jgi:hypothetical protein
VSAGAGVVHPLSGDETVSMNMWGFTPSLFQHLREQFAGFLTANAQNGKSEFYIPSVVNTLIVSGQSKCKVLRTPDSWFGVTYREDRPFVVEGIRKLVVHGGYPEKLWA